MKECIFSPWKYLSANHWPRVDNHIKFYSYSYQPYLFHVSYPTLWWIVACTFLEYFELTNSLFIFSNYRGPVFQHALGILKFRHKALLKILNFSRQSVLLKGQTLVFFAPTNLRWTIGNSNLHLVPWSVFQLETMEHQKISRIIELLPIIGTLSL